MPQFSFKTCCFSQSSFATRIWFRLLRLTYGLNSTQSPWHLKYCNFDFCPIAFFHKVLGVSSTPLPYTCLQYLLTAYRLFPNTKTRSFSRSILQKKLGHGVPHQSSFQDFLPVVLWKLKPGHLTAFTKLQSCFKNYAGL